MSRLVLVGYDLYVNPDNIFSTDLNGCVIEVLNINDKYVKVKFDTEAEAEMAFKDFIEDVNGDGNG